MKTNDSLTPIEILIIIVLFLLFVGAVDTIVTTSPLDLGRMLDRVLTPVKR